MFKMTALYKKTFLAALLLAIAFTATPTSGTSAAGLNGQTNSLQDISRLERVWRRERAIYQFEGNRLTNASNFIAGVQALIDKANQKGWDTTSVQADLNALSAVIPAVQTAHNPGAAIIASHAGFDANGKVTDRATAIATVKSLTQVLKGTRAAMNGAGKALRAAIRDLRDAHPRPLPTPIS